MRMKPKPFWPNFFSAKHRLSKDFIKMARILVGNNVTIWSPKREQPTT